MNQKKLAGILYVVACLACLARQCIKRTRNQLSAQVLDVYM